MNKLVKKTKEVAKKTSSRSSKSEVEATKESTKQTKSVEKPTKAAAKPGKPAGKPAEKQPAKILRTAQQPQKAVSNEPVVKEAAPAVKAAKPVVKASVKSGSTLAHGVGRRKSAVARVWLKRGKGNLVVNDKNYVDYFDTEISRMIAYIPFQVYQPASNYDVSVNVVGGGLCAQADAIKLGIARALVSMNEEIRPMLRSHGLLTVDSRVKERKKYGQKAARRKFQFVKR